MTERQWQLPVYCVMYKKSSCTSFLYLFISMLSLFFKTLCIDHFALEKLWQIDHFSVIFFFYNIYLFNNSIKTLLSQTIHILKTFLC